MAKHKKKSMATHKRKKRNKELKAIGEQFTDGFQKGAEEHGRDESDEPDPGSES